MHAACNLAAGESIGEIISLTAVSTFILGLKPGLLINSF
jgi:hypothetical protein